MSAEILSISKENVVRATALLTALVVVSGASVVIAREISGRRIRSMDKDNQDSGDSGFVFTRERV